MARLIHLLGGYTERDVMLEVQARHDRIVSALTHRPGQKPLRAYGGTWKPEHE